MPRGYELNTYYDALRAVHRKLYSAQIKNLSGTIESCGLRTSDAYRLIISSLNKGIYENLSENLFKKSHFGNDTRDYIGYNKSSYDQDFMSPLELRLNSIAVRRAEKQINKIANKRMFSLNDIQDICYACGQEVAREFGYLIDGDEEFSLHIKQPVLSSKPILKKYEHSLSMGTLPKGKVMEFETQEEKQEKERLIYLNNTTFSKIKSRLIELGLTTMSQRLMAFAKFNAAYYETDAGNSHILEISKILISDKAEDYVTIKELEMNCEKLSFMLAALNEINYSHIERPIFNKLFNAGERARQLIVAKHRTLPELYSGFYHAYIDADRRLSAQKAIKNNTNQCNRDKKIK